MIKSKFKRVTSLFLATLMCVTTFAGIGSTTAYAASGEKADVYMVDFPRDGDANYDGVWGHSNLTLKNGWHTGRSNFTNLKAIGSYSGNVAYCIEPGISLKVGQTMNKYDENYFNNLAANGVISGDEIRLFVGRILQYGYRGTISTSWRSQNEAAANSIAQAYATQLLIWETVIGERDANFNHVAASGCSNVKDVINAKHPLRNKIFSYYNSMVQSVQNHATISLKDLNLARWIRLRLSVKQRRLSQTVKRLRKKSRPNPRVKSLWKKQSEIQCRKRSEQTQTPQSPKQTKALCQGKTQSR